MNIRRKSDFPAPPHTEYALAVPRLAQLLGAPAVVALRVPRTVLPSVETYSEGQWREYERAF